MIKFLLFLLLSSCGRQVVEFEKKLLTSKAVGADSSTSATPGVSKKILDDKHSGFKMSNCMGCHDLTHGGNNSASCVVCHGYNGAPVMKASEAHQSDSCLSCHKGSHLGQEFKQVDCISCHKFEKKDDPCSVTYDTDVVVIGAGGGGLAAAATLAKGGKKVVVIEQNHKVGGYMSNFKRGDYTFEVSLHGFDGMGKGSINEKLFELLGIINKVTPVREDIVYKSIYPDMEIDVPQDIEEYKALLLEMFPHEKNKIKKFFKEMVAIDSAYRELIYYNFGLNDNRPGIGNLFKLFNLSKKRLSDYLKNDIGIRDEKLYHIITQLAGFLGVSPNEQSATLFLVMWNSYHRYGYYNFIGGSQSISDALKEVIEENNGILRFGTRGVKIIVEGRRAKKVRTDTNVCYTAKHFISNASIPATMYNLIGEENLSKKDINRYKHWKVGLSMVVVYLGVSKDYSREFDNIGEHMISVSYNPDDAYQIARSCRYDGPFALNNYTLVDPSNVSKTGKNVIAISLLADINCHEKWMISSGFDNYKKFKNDLGMRLVKRVENYLPNLSKHIEFMEVGTPVTMKGYTSNPMGTIFGWDHVISQVMFNRMANTKLDNIDNLHLVGAWAFPGGGQSAVLNGGFMAGRDILKSENNPDGPVAKFFKWLLSLLNIRI